MDILENPGLRGRAFVDTSASLGDTLEDGPSREQLGTNNGQHRITWGHLGANLGPTGINLDQLGPTWANLGPTWGQLGPTWANMAPLWTQLGVHLGPTWANLDQLGPIWIQLKPAWTKMSQCRPTWGQLEAHTDLKIMEKLLFFLSFSNILR